MIRCLNKEMNFNMFNWVRREYKTGSQNGDKYKSQYT